MDIVRVEERLSREGKPEVFCHVMFSHDDYGKYPFGHWLTSEEMEEYNKDKTSVRTIMERYFDRATELHIQALNAPPIEELINPEDLV